MNDSYCHDAFVLTAAVLRAICAALPLSQRQVVADELLIQAQRLNDGATDESMQHLAGSLAAFAALARDEPDQADAVLDAMKRR